MAKLKPTRRLDLDGAYNVRELGGYSTKYGRETRWKTFLRADSLHRLTKASQTALLDYGIKTVIDLRESVELRERPNVFHCSPSISYYHRPLRGDNPYMKWWIFWNEPIDENHRQLDSEDPSDRGARGIIAALEHLKPEIYSVFTLLAEPSLRPVVFHCAAGKDRTGIVAALLLGIAGVSPETIAADYSLSAQYWWKQESSKISCANGHENYRREFCPPEAMLKVICHLEKRYGGVENYLLDIGINYNRITSLKTSLVHGKLASSK